MPTSPLARSLVLAGAALLSSCTNPELRAPPIDPDVARAEIAKRLPPKVMNRDGWAIDIFAVKTEKELNDIFADFTNMVPLGGRMFGSLNPVHTAGPMQVSIAYAEQHANEKRYPYPVATTIRNEVFTRRGGMYFGIAHLLDYPADYDDMLYRFADFNAGHYASRNAGFQNAVSVLTKTPLALDGDLLLHGSSDPSQTELATRKLAAKLDMTDTAIRRDLEHGDQDDFADTKLCKRVFDLANKGRKTSLPRAVVPKIRLESPKITRKLTTEWFARRVDERYEKCLARH